MNGCYVFANLKPIRKGETFMNCLNCNAQIASTEVYCPFCGEQLAGNGQPF
ncbi:MAG: zinc-ribbon domain-containing protein [Alphaproteobacteria bacterium]|nr:zinc-ribbon domain-containing protein [Alphaproteobacteria bacterium]